MRRFLRWVLGIGDAQDFTEVMRRLDSAEDDVNHLGRRFTKLQSQVTRSWREQVSEEDDESEEDEFLRLVEERRGRVGE